MASGFIDSVVLSELLDSAGVDFVADLVKTLSEEVPHLFEELHRSQLTGDDRTFRRAAHSLKSNALIFGAIRMAELAQDLEQVGHTTDPTTIKELEYVISESLGLLRRLCDD